MSKIKLRDVEMNTAGTIPSIGENAPDFMATKADLSTFHLADFKGEPLLINVFPSIDTKVCFGSVKQFNHEAQQQTGKIICISMDSPFALKRIAEGECFNDVTLLSDIRNREFGELYGLTIVDGPLAGFLARAVIVLDAEHNVLYSELVQDVANSPDFCKALEKLISACA